MTLIAVIILAACAPRPTLQELESEATVTGDWSKVERREELLKERLKAQTTECPDPTIKACIEEGLNSTCYCVRPVAD